ncbi:MAG: hypothetical protein M0Q42_05665 [Xanthomonadales bacterium]|nr:hypothetical protein [Xanthomonadales bacterium]
MTFPLRFSCALALLALLTAAPAIHAATYAVGVGNGCTHSTLQAALNTAAATAGGQHTIKLAVSEMLVANVTVSNPAADLIIEGGYSACNAATATGTTTLRKISTVPLARIFEFSNTASSATPRRHIRLRRLTITGGRSNQWGGGIYAIGKISLHVQNRVRLIDNHASSGGAIALLSGLGENNTILTLNGGDTNVERPLLENNRATGPGANGNGGAIHAAGGARVGILNGRIINNQARGNGGGISMATSNASLIFNNYTALPVEITGNVAGTDGFSVTKGFGGGIYVDMGTVLQLEEELPIPQLLISQNEANVGGGVYIRGLPEGRTSASFLSTHITSNTAHSRGGGIYTINGADLNLSHRQAGGWCLAVILPVRCSRIAGNRVSTQGVANTPRGAALYMESEGGLPSSATGTARIERTVIETNNDQGGSALIYVGSRERLTIEASVLRNNTASGSNSVLVHGAGPNHALQVHYSTVLANTVSRLFHASAQQIDVQGSILWAPGKTLAYLNAGATFNHNGCLLSHTLSQVGDTAHVQTSDPLLDSQFRSRGRSPGIDVCDNFSFEPIADINMNPRGYRVNGITEIWGLHDLGAFEQRDILFYGGFGSRAQN